MFSKWCRVGGCIPIEIEGIGADAYIHIDIKDPGRSDRVDPWYAENETDWFVGKMLCKVHDRTVVCWRQNDNTCLCRSRRTVKSQVGGRVESGAWRKSGNGIEDVCLLLAGAAGSDFGGVARAGIGESAMWRFMEVVGDGAPTEDVSVVV